MIVILMLILLFLLYRYTTKNHDYWRKRNIKYEKPIPVFGTSFEYQIGRKSTTEICTALYKKYSGEPVVGVFRGTTPELLVKDLEIVRRIVNADFEHFYIRGVGRNPKIETQYYNIFHAEGDLWKLLRQRLTPTFTTAKLKKMFPLVVKCAEKLQDVGDDIVNRGGECDVRDLMARFTIEFIGACGFGIEMDTINTEHSFFVDFGHKIFITSFRSYLLFGLYDLFPDFGSIIQKLLKTSDIIGPLTELVKNIRTQRNFKPIGRHDFIDLLLELEGEGKIIGESIEKRNADGTPEKVEMEMDVTCMAAQAYIFFAAGYETSSTATSFMLHQLAYHPEEQKKIQEEIDGVLSKYDNKLCYDSISEMNALSNGLKEAMRIFPPGGTMTRVCTRKYTIPELNLTLDPGVKILIPVQAIQNDEKYFNNPSQFMPDRFNDPNVGRHKYAYMPFGGGPRSCIGGRLGTMQSMAGLAALLQKFSVEPGPNTQRYPEVDHGSKTIQAVKGALPLILTLRNKSNVAS